MKLILSILLLLSIDAFSQKFTVNNGVVTADNWGSDNDITNELDAALAFTYANGTSLQLPYGLNFRISKTVIVKNSINLLGTGTPLKPTTRIGFPSYVKCFYFNYKDEAGGVMHSSLSNVQLYQDFVTDYKDTTAHGVHARSIVRLDNVFIEFASGNGFHLEGDQIPGHPVEGTVNFSELINCHAAFVNHGLFIQGGDANKINIYKFNAAPVRRWGVYDDGFLGNMYNSPHFAFCGSGLYSDVVAVYNGQHYAAISEEAIINKGFRPDLFPQYWEKVTPMGHSAPWESTKRYWSGGPYWIVNVNAATTVADPYMEGFQPNARQAQGTLSLHGTRGAEIKGGTDIKAGGSFQVGTSLNIAGFENSLTINSPDISASKLAALAIKSHNPSNANTFKESANWRSVFDVWQNNFSKGTFEYLDDRFVFYPNGVKSLEVSPTATYLHKAPTSTSTKFLVRNPDNSIGERDFPVGNVVNGVSQSAFDTLQTKVNSLDAILATKASKEDVKAVSELLAALTVRVNALPTGNTPSPQLTQLIADMQAILIRLNQINN